MLNETPLSIFAEFSPTFTPSPFQQDMVEQQVTDMARWRQTMEFWFGNNYRPQSIQKMLIYYEGLVNGINKQGSYGSKRTDHDVARESADFYENFPES